MSIPISQSEDESLVGTLNIPGSGERERFRDFALPVTTCPALSV